MTQPGLPCSPAADRNKEPILQVLRAALPAHADVLEIAAGTGQHAAHFAAANAGWTWQPTDADGTGLDTIAARCAGLPNVRAPLRLDVLAPWPPGLGRFDAIYCANMLHISPWATCPALMRLAAHHLVPAGLLVLYGPYVVDGEPTAPGNLAFDAALRAQDAHWGVRRLADVVQEAATAGLAFAQRVAMPANNLCVMFRSEAG
jgi:SAM-dependent methyltransferase